MAKKLNVELGFSANTSSAKKQIDDLINQLQKIQTTPSKVFDDKDLKDASKAAQELQQHIRNAVNTDTGKLDLTKFATSLSKSNTNLEYFRKQLTKAGTDGKNSFASLTNAIAQADAPMLKLNGRLGEFVTTLKNSARWQISSNILHGFESALGSAIGYAKDLDESLNSIRIVTGKSTDDMAAFAKEANEAAKALSTTTTNYTDASLIYYQQGLSDEEVKKRTDITVKMGNAAQESAEEVSQYMTAIWENYYDGSEALESYADKITALGAATASSSKEIANGLEKFVAVGDQIGLSYDYATAALTTILAKTRQSEDVVGTALKTIFARIQGFNLGETADDGVTLNKYSSALKAVGVDVLDANGEMKEMDTILDDLASKWGTLGKAQQNALAQTVAGVRQYTQLVSLMDNWDFFKENLDTVQNSDGALQEQADIFADSWEAARKRVKASWEGIYDDLIDTDGIIKLDNALADTLDILDDVINNFGGLQGILETIAGFMMQKFAKEVPGALNNLLASLNLMTNKSQSQATQMLEEVAKQQRQVANNELGASGLPTAENLTYSAELQQSAKLAELKATLAKESKNLSSQEKEEAQRLIEITEARYKDIQAIGKQIEEQKKAEESKVSGLASSMANRTVTSEGKSDVDYNKDLAKATTEYQKQIDTVKKLSFSLGELKELKATISEQKDIWEDPNTKAQQFEQSLKLIIQSIEETSADLAGTASFEKLTKQFDELQQHLKDGSGNFDEIKNKILDTMTELAGDDVASELEISVKSAQDRIQELVDSLKSQGFEEEAKQVEQLGKAFEKLGSRAQNGAQGLRTLNEVNIPKHLTKISEGIFSTIGALSQLTSSFQSVANGFNTVTSSSATTSEKITAATSSLMSLGFAGKSAISTFKGLAEATSVGFAGALGIATVAISVLLAGISYASQKKEEEIKKAREEAQNSLNEIDEIQEEVDKLNSLSEKYSDAKKNFDETKNADNNSALIDSTRDLAEELNNEIDALKDTHSELENVNEENIIAQGTYNDLEQSIRDVTKARMEDKAEAAKIAMQDAGIAFSKSMTKGRGNTLFGEYQADINANHYNKYLDESLSKADSSKVKYNTYSGQINLRADYDPNDIEATYKSEAETYKEVLDAVTEAKKNASAAGADELQELENSDGYKNLVSWLEKAKDDYDLLTQSTNEFKDANGNQYLQDTLTAFSDVNVDSVKEYSKVVDDLAERLAKQELGYDQDATLTDDQLAAVEKEAENQKELAQSTLEASGAYDEFASSYGAAQDAIAKATKSKDEGGSGWDSSKVDLNDYYLNHLQTDDERKLFVQLDFDQDQSVKNLDAQLDYLQAQADSNKVVNITTSIDAALGALASSKSDKMSTIQSLIDWGKDGIESFEEFSQKTEEEQFATLIELGRKFAQSTDENTKKSKDEMNKALEEIKQNRQDLETELAAAQDKVNNAKTDLEKGQAQKEVEALQEQLNNMDADIEAKKEEIDNFTADKGFNPTYETNEDYLDKLSDLDKLNTLLSTGQELSGGLKQELADMIVSLDNTDIEEKFKLLTSTLQSGKIDVDNFNEALLQLSSSGEVTAEHLQEIFMQDDGSIDKDLMEGYSENLQAVAQNYDNCTAALERYQQALASGNEAQQEAAQSALELSVRAGEDGEKYGVDAERLEILASTYLDEAKSLKAVTEEGANAAEIAEDMAVAEVRLNAAIEDLYSNWDDYKSIVEVCNDTLAEGTDATVRQIMADGNLSKSFIQLRKDVAGLLNTSEDMLGSEWIVTQMDNIQAAAEGDEAAIEALRESAAQEILLNTNVDSVWNDIDGLSAAINEIPDGEIDLESDNFIQGLVYVMQQAGMARDEIETALQGMGISVDLDEADQSLQDAINDFQWNGEIAGKAFADGVAANAGVDAETVTKQDKAEDEQTYSGFKVNMHQNRDYGNVPVISGNSLAGFHVEQVPTTYITYDEQIDPVPEKTTDTKQQTTMALKVKSASKESGGHITTTNKPGGTNRQPAATRTRAARTPRSSSGSRSTPRAKTFRASRDVNVSDIFNDDKKKLKDEKERYHVINNQLEDISHNLADIAQLKDRAFGKNKLNALKAENKELQNQAKAQAKLVKETEKYLKADKAAVEALGATIGSDGTITNYDSLVSNKVKSYNNSVLTYAKMQKAAEDEYNKAMQAATNRYNASGRTDADSAIYDAAVERAKERKDEADKEAERYKKQADDDYQDFVDKIDQYEETYDKMREEKLKEQQIQDQIYDNELETIQYEVEIKVDVDEDTLKFLNELFDQMGDSADYAADRIANLTKQAKAYNDEAKAYENGISSILKHAGADQELINGFINGNLTSDQIKEMGALGFTEGDAETLRDYSDKLIELNKNYRDLRDTMIDQVSAAFDEYIEKLEDASEKIEKLQKVTETYKSIIDVVGKRILDPTGKVTKALDDAAFNSARNLTKSNKATLDFAENALAEAKKTRDSLAKQYGEDNETVRKWDEQVKELENKRDDAYSNWLDAWEAECEAARTTFEDTLESIVTNFETKISGLAGSLDMLNDAYERQSKVDEVYVDDYEKIYQLSKLSREISKSIDDTSQVKNKEKLKKLQDEIVKKQEQGVKLSQYDLDYLEKKYQLELARQQLEEAKNAKTQVTMKRDSEGNYGYVYTADASAVADAEQNYEDRLHELQQLNSEYIKTLQGDIIQIQQDLENDLKNFAENFKGTQEEYEKGVAEITEKYKTLMEYKQQQMQNVLSNNRDLYMNDWKSYSEATGYKLSADEDYLDKWEETNYSIITGYETLEDAMNAWRDGVEQVTNDANEAYRVWYEQTNQALEDGGTSMDNFATKAGEVAGEVTSQTDKIADSAQEMAETFETSFKDILENAKTFSQQFEDVIMGIIDSNTKLADSIRKVLAEASKASSSTNSGTNGSYTGGTSDSVSGNGSSTGGSSSTGADASGLDFSDGTSNKNKNTNKNTGKKTTTKLDNKTKYGVALAIIEGTYGWGDDPYRSGKLTQKFGANNGIQAIVNKLWAEGKVFSGAWEGAYYGLTSKDMPKYAYNRFNTGGYTGYWPGDTGKLAFLDSKEIVLNKDDTANFLSAVDIVRDIAKTIDLTASSASNSFSKLFAAAGIKTAATTLEQQVHITAEFPNATDKNEILDAFDNVINLATQYANRNK
jgi:TP901 family phage tail tape measure protein